MYTVQPMKDYDTGLIEGWALRWDDSPMGSGGYRDREHAERALAHWQATGELLLPSEIE